MTNSEPFKSALRLFQSCFNTIKNPQRLLQANVKITTSYSRDNFKDDFKTTVLNSTQLGTTQPQLVSSIFLLLQHWLKRQ